MKRKESGCVGCPVEIGCFGSSCPLFEVTHYYCDRCEKEDTLYHYDDEELCLDCLLKNFDIVEGSEW